MVKTPISQLIQVDKLSTKYHVFALYEHYLSLSLLIVIVLHDGKFKTTFQVNEGSR